MTGPVIEFREVTRTFGGVGGIGRRTVALDRFSLAIAAGEVVALVGRNGAGKTTALRLANGVLWPDAGTVRVLGLDPVEDGLAVRARVALLSEESALSPWMTVSEILRYGAALAPRWDARVANEFVERLALDPRARIRSLSRGTKAKVALVLAVGARPEVLLLDDPTAGLDPLVRREVLEGILAAIHGEGGAVVYASHLIHDLERVADRVVYLDAGRIRLEGSLDELRRRVKRLTAVFASDAWELPPSPFLLDQRADGRSLVMIAQGRDDGDRPELVELVHQLRSLGATHVTVEDLGLEEILVAALRHRAPAQEVAHV
jgi:ABC-2 type transport system ATP-binding protein